MEAHANVHARVETKRNKKVRHRGLRRPGERARKSYKATESTSTSRARAPFDIPALLANPLLMALYKTILQRRHCTRHTTTSSWIIAFSFLSSRVKRRIPCRKLLMLCTKSRSHTNTRQVAFTTVCCCTACPCGRRADEAPAKMMPSYHQLAQEGPLTRCHV